MQLNSGTYPGAGIINRCFFDYAEEAAGKIEFSRIVINQPFSKVGQHVKGALSLPSRGGHAEPADSVALVPITFEHEDAYILETSPDTTFATVKVSTKIVRYQNKLLVLACIICK